MEMPSDNAIAVGNIENSLNQKDNYILLDSQNQTQELQAHFFQLFNAFYKQFLLFFNLHKSNFKQQ